MPLGSLGAAPRLEQSSCKRSAAGAGSWAQALRLGALGADLVTLRLEAAGGFSLLLELVFLH